ncbi:MAG: hypothetical protein V4476_19580 [Pseudomonadota bacterium]
MTKQGELSTQEAQDRAHKITPDQAAILAGAAAVEATLGSTVPLHDADGNLVEAEPVVDHLAGNRQILTFLVTAATPALPFLAQCYTPEVIDQIAGAFTAVEEKYGWDIGSSVGPELALAITALPPTVMAYLMGRAHFAELKAKREAEGRVNQQQVQHGGASGLQGATKGAIGG